MTRRLFLTAISSLPFLGWLKPRGPRMTFMKIIGPAKSDGLYAVFRTYDDQSYTCKTIETYAEFSDVFDELRNFWHAKGKRLEVILK